MAELLEQIQRLDRRELVALIREAAARLDALEQAEDDWKLSPEQMAQIDAVRDAYQRDGNPGESWETVRARIVAQLLRNQHKCPANEFAGHLCQEVY